MKRLLSKEEIEAKETRNKTILSIILVLLLVFSSVGYAFYQSSSTKKEKVEYKDIEFAKESDGLWHFFIGESEFATYYNPLETENMSSDISLNFNDYYQKKVYFSQSSILEGADEISRNLGRFAYFQYACLGECEENFPEKNCSDNIIIIQESSENLIKQEENCIYIMTSQENVIKASDKFLFSILL